MIRRLSIRMVGASRSTKRLIILGYDALAMVVALALAFVTRFSSLQFPDEPLVLAIVALCTAIGIGSLYVLGVYHTVTRFLDIREVKRFALAAMIVGLTWVAVLYMVQLHEIPRSIGVIWPAYLTLFWFGGRYLVAALISDNALEGNYRASGRPVLIYGANAAGIALAEAMRSSTLYRAVCFIDDDPVFWGQRLAGLRVHPPTSLKRLVADLHIADACLAFQSAGRAERIAALELLTEHHLNVKTAPAPEDLLNGQMTVSDIRPVNVNDLLSRDMVRPHRDLIERAAAGRTILITGAGGSIGSEICRQLLRERPVRLVLLDHSEFALFAISQELIGEAEAMPNGDRPELVPVIGSILDVKLLRETVEVHGIDTIFHAAAYKHVPLLESNEVNGVQNNVIGTHNLVRVATEFGLRRFVMISTDKAVRPANVMGASKRAAELIVQAAAEEPGCRTAFGIVRFGNVLDSSGSVVQLFRRQINEGRAVTVTDRDVTRFFMSIPEATQLVLQASAMAERGEVFVLDMGEPVRIHDLAVNMIRLSGLTVRDEHNPDGDIPIHYVGLRPGEKLYEELFVGGESEPTIHPRINKARERLVPGEELEREIDRIRDAIRDRDAAAVRATLMALVAEDHAVPAEMQLAARSGQDRAYSDLAKSG
jgi:FlaA1/EpsC-like NDP-sugar epimerase